MRKAIQLPAKAIAENAGHNFNEIRAKLIKDGNKAQGFDSSKGEFVEMVKAGIIDPTKVVRCALQDSSSVASLMLTTECIIV